MPVRPEEWSLEIRQDRPKREPRQRGGLRLDEVLSPTGQPLKIISAKKRNDQTAQSGLCAGGGDGLKQGLCERLLFLWDDSIRAKADATKRKYDKPYQGLKREL